MHMKKYLQLLYLQIILTCIFLFSSFVVFVNAQVDDVVGTQEKQILDTILNERYYDKNFRPTRSNVTGPLDVKVNLIVNRIRRLDEMNMELEMTFTLKQEWMDERLRFSHLNGNMEQLPSPYLAMGKIWKPDLYFFDEVQSPSTFNANGPNSHVRIFSDGTVLYTTKISGSFHCPLNLQRFPHDVQICRLRMGSNAYTKEDVQFKWADNDTIETSLISGVPKFILNSIVTQYCTTGDSESDDKSCIEAEFYFERQIEMYLLQVFIPCIMLIIISFLSLCLHPIKMAVPRIFVSLIALALGVCFVSLLNVNLPPVPYTKSLDIWTAVILFFLFFPVIIFIVVNCACRYRSPPRVTFKNNVEDNSKEFPTVLNQFNSIYESVQFDYSVDRRASNIDCVSRILFPILFIIFLVIYWFLCVQPGMQ